MATRKAKHSETAQIRELIDDAGGPAAFCKRVWPREDYDANKAKVSKWKGGGSGIARTEALRIAAAFKVRPAWLLFGEHPKTPGMTRAMSSVLPPSSLIVPGGRCSAIVGS